MVEPFPLVRSLTFLFRRPMWVRRHSYDAIRTLKIEVLQKTSRFFSIDFRSSSARAQTFRQPTAPSEARLCPFLMEQGGSVSKTNII